MLVGIMLVCYCFTAIVIIIIIIIIMITILIQFTIDDNIVMIIIRSRETRRLAAAPKPGQ